ncbi:hypothetical protein ACEWFU_05890 [Bifidobacterium hominis]|uniref:hypothetical protein n=1 Tax=Bifidobacterium hominis TaxID=3133177 RepID=UPI003CFCB0D6
MVKEQTIKSNLKRIWILEREVLFWSLALMAFFLVFDRAGFGMKTIVRSAAPTIMGLWWYVTAYATFLALLPFLSRGGATRARRTHALHTCHNGADNMSVYVQCFFDKITAVFHSVGGSRFSHDWQRTGQALVSGYDSASWFPIAFLMNEKYTGYKITPSSQQRRNPKLRRNSDVIYLVVCRCVRFEQSFLMRVKSSANSEYGQVQR